MIRASCSSTGLLDPSDRRAVVRASTPATGAEAEPPRVPRMIATTTRTATPPVSAKIWVGESERRGGRATDSVVAVGARTGASGEASGEGPDGAAPRNATVAGRGASTAGSSDSTDSSSIGCVAEDGCGIATERSKLVASFGVADPGVVTGFVIGADSGGAARIDGAAIGAVTATELGALAANRSPGGTATGSEGRRFGGTIATPDTGVAVPRLGAIRSRAAANCSAL